MRKAAVRVSELRRRVPGESGLLEPSAADIDCRLLNGCWPLRSSSEIPSISQSSFCASVMALNSDDGDSVVGPVSLVNTTSSEQKKHDANLYGPSADLSQYQDPYEAV